MHTLTVKQPYASLIALQLKKLETRPWRTAYRGLLLIHAAKKPDPAGWTPQVRQAFAAFGVTELDQLVTGMVIAKCNLVGCFAHEDLAADADLSRLLTPWERTIGKHGPGRYAWWLHYATPVRHPWPAAGKLGIWQARRPRVPQPC